MIKKRLQLLPLQLRAWAWQRADTRLQKTAILYHRAAQIKLLSIVTKRKRKLQKRQYHRPLRPVRTGNRVLRLPKLPIKLLLQAQPRKLVALLQKIRHVPCSVVPTVTCKQRGHPTAGPFLGMATRPLLETMEVSRITKKHPLLQQGMKVKQSIEVIMSCIKLIIQEIN